MILETCPSTSRAEQLLEGMQQNKTPEKNHMVCIVSKDVVQHFNKTAYIDYFLEKTALAN